MDEAKRDKVISEIFQGYEVLHKLVSGLHEIIHKQNKVLDVQNTSISNFHDRLKMLEDKH